MTVYAVNMMRDTDLSAAAAFGDIKYVNIKYVFGDELEQTPLGNVLPLATLKALHDCARQFDPDRDYLLIAGDHLQLVAMAGILGNRYSHFRVLRWDRQAQGYIPVVIQTQEHYHG